MFAGNIKLERMLRIKKECQFKIILMNWESALDKKNQKETTNRIKFGVTKYRIPEEGRDRKG